MWTKRQRNQHKLVPGTEAKGEAPSLAAGATEVHVAKTELERPAASEPTMERIVERDNLRRALERVRRNKGAPGIDGMTVEALAAHLKNHWPEIKEKLLLGIYRPEPVRRVEIPKATGGTRSLGIPTVLDRFIQQAVMQVLQAGWDPTFSDSSFGFRPGRSAHQAVHRAQEYIGAGHCFVTDLDLEKFFDRVNHDILMGLVAKRVTDKRVLKLIRSYLNAGVMEGGLVGPTDEGVPQGGPLSPLLSNLMLDVLDKELERRGHRFVRYADDCNIYVRSRRAGERVMASVTCFLERRLKLKVNAEKSAVAPPSERKFLSFSFTKGSRPRRRIAPQALARFRARVRKLTRRLGGRSLPEVIAGLRRYLVGWRAYFGICQSPSSLLREQDAWIRRRLRAIAWTNWKHGRTRYAELRRRGVHDKHLAAATAASQRSSWRLSASRALCFALPNAHLASLGLPSLVKTSPLASPNRRIRTRTSGGVGGAEP